VTSRVGVHRSKGERRRTVRRCAQNDNAVSPGHGNGRRVGQPRDGYENMRNKPASSETESSSARAFMLRL
jgi:hypothetical protein